jgi:C1A family cysteine protease
MLVMPETTHPRHLGPRLQRDPDHHTHPQQPADIYAPEDLPAQVDLRPHCPPIVDQGQTESCTANALAGAYGYLEGRIAGKEVPVSRLFIYYNERDIEGAVAKDEGAVISDGVKVLKKYGACEESTWPFDPKKVKEKPHAEAYDAGKGHEIDQAATVAVDLHAMKHCLAEGYPFVFGLLIDDFKPDAKGFLKRPTSTKGLGGHAMCCVGYIDAKKVFIIRNSWGTSWGDKGYGYVPYDWLTDKESTHDCWTIRRAHDLDFSEVGKADDESAAAGDEDEDEDEDADGEEGDAEEGDDDAEEGDDDAEEGDDDAEEGDDDAEDGDDDAEEGDDDADDADEEDGDDADEGDGDEEEEKKK